MKTGLFSKYNKYLIAGVTIFLYVIFCIHMLHECWGNLGTDLPSFYYGAKLAFEESLTPYLPKHWFVAQKSFPYEADLWPFLYLPPSLFFFLPLIKFDLVTANNLVLVLNLILTAVFAYCFLYEHILNSKAHLGLLVGSLYLVLFYPLYRTIDAGQVNLVVLLALSFMWIGVIKKWHPGAIAMLLAVAILLKLYPVIFLGYFFIKKQYQVLVWVLVILLAVSLLAGILLPDNMWIDWLRNIASKGYGEKISNMLHPGSFANQSLNGFFTRFFLGKGKQITGITANIFEPGQAEKINKTANYFSLALLVGVSFLAIWRMPPTEQKDTSERVKHEISILLLLQFIISPFSWDHHLVIVLPALFYAATLCIDKYRGWTVRVVLGICLVFLGADFNFSNPLWQTGWLTLLISAKLYSVLIVWGILVIDLFGWTKSKNTVVRWSAIN